MLARMQTFPNLDIHLADTRHQFVKVREKQLDDGRLIGTAVTHDKIYRGRVVFQRSADDRPRHERFHVGRYERDTTGGCYERDHLCAYFPTAARRVSTSASNK